MQTKQKAKNKNEREKKKISTKIRIENIYENISICRHCTHVRAYCKYIHFCKVNGKSDRDRESVMKNKTEKKMNLPAFFIIEYKKPEIYV